MKFYFSLAFVSIVIDYIFALIVILLDPYRPIENEPCHESKIKKDPACQNKQDFPKDTILVQ